MNLNVLFILLVLLAMFVFAAFLLKLNGKQLH